MFKISLLRSCTVYKIRWKLSDQNTELCLGSAATARVSQGNNNRKITSSTISTHNITTLTTLHKFNNINVTTSPVEPDHLLPGLVVGDDSLQVAWQGLHDGLHVALQSFNDNICQG